VNVTTTNSWPAELPAPRLDYYGEPFYQNLVSTEEAPIILRSSRFVRPYPVIQAVWVLTNEQFSTFETFWETNLGHGVAWFTLDLRYPKNSSLSNWVVRFEGEYQAEKLDQELWQITAPLILLHEL